MANDNGGIIGIINTPTSSTASGVWSLDSQYQAQTTGTWPPIPAIGLNSARFDDGSSDNLTKTFSTDGTSADIGTISMWLKRSVISSEQVILSAGTSARDFFRFESDDTLTFRRVSTYQLTTSQVFRDVSAWYHIVLAFDTTQATASNRIKLYVNGNQVTAFGTASYPSINLDIKIGSAQLNAIGKDSEQTTPYFDGYMSDVNFVDGQQLDPTSFGAFNANGVWTPIPLNISSYGTNGFRLKFENSADLGEDASPNGNNFTVNNLTSVDQSGDYPVNNFITMNPNNATLGSVTLSEGNLKASLNGNYQVFGTINVTSGKWYWEQKIISSDLFVSVADGNRATEDTGTGLLNRDYAWAYRSDGVKQHDSVTASYGDSFTTNDIIGVALDMDNGFIYFSKNGVFQNSGDPTSGATGTGAAYSGLNTDAAAPNGLTPCLGQYSGDQITSWNFGSPPYAVASGNADANGYGNFEYTVPSGYYSLCTKNLAEYG